MSRVKVCTLILVGTLAVAIIVFLSIWLANSNPLKFYSENEAFQKSELFNKAVHKYNIWFLMSVLWLCVNYLGIILTFEISAIILYLEIYENNKHTAIIVFSIISMALIIFTYAIRPHVHTEGYRRASVRMDQAINQYLVEFDDNLLAYALSHSEIDISVGYETEINVDFNNK